MILNPSFIKALFPDDILEKDPDSRVCYRPKEVVNEWLTLIYNNHDLLKEINNLYVKEVEFNSEKHCDKIIVKNLRDFCHLQYMCSKFNNQPDLKFQRFLGRAIFGLMQCSITSKF